MSKALELIRQRQAEKLAAIAGEKSETPKAVAKTVVTVTDEKRKEIAAAEKVQLTEERERNSAPIDFPAEIYDIPGLDVDKLGNALQEMQRNLENQESIHKLSMKLILENIREYEELAYILADEQIGIISKSAMKMANIEIAVAKTPKSKKAPKIDLTKMDLSSISL